jgi:hypothetical protein
MNEGMKCRVQNGLGLGGHGLALRDWGVELRDWAVGAGLRV